MGNTNSNVPSLNTWLMGILVALASWALLKLYAVGDDTTKLVTRQQYDRSDIDALKASDLKQDIRLGGVETDLAVIKARADRR